jgi:hypothetical protein
MVYLRQDFSISLDFQSIRLKVNSLIARLPLSENVTQVVIEESLGPNSLSPEQYRVFGFDKLNLRLRGPWVLEYCFSDECACEGLLVAWDQDRDGKPHH